MTRRLYVIGNGFDLHHGVPSNYGAFGRYVRSRDREVHEKVEEYLFGDSDDVRANFEANLANLDVDTLADHASQWLGSYNDDDFSAAAYDDYQWAIGEVASALSGELHRLFVHWVGTLPVPAPAGLSIDTRARYLNFNYTPTLQAAYGVDEANILHIHGRSGAAPNEIILGHGMGLPAPGRRIGGDDREVDFRVLEGERIIRDYFKDTAKPTKAVLHRHAAFFAGLGDVSEVWVMGHSVGDVDFPYFREILRSTAPGTAWKVSYYGDPSGVREQLEAVGVLPGAMTFLPIDRF